MNKFMIGDVVKITADFRIINIRGDSTGIIYEIEELDPHASMDNESLEITEEALAKTTFLGAP